MRPVIIPGFLTGLVQREARLGLPRRQTALANPPEVVLHLRGIGGPLFAQELARHAHSPAGIEHMHDRSNIDHRIYLDRRMGRAGRRTADQQRDINRLALHFRRHKHHFIQRWRDQPGQADNVGLFIERGFQDRLTGHHHTQINNFIAIALHDHADDVLANIVDIAFHGGEHNLAGRGPGLAGSGLFLLHKGDQMGDGLFHHPGGFHHLGQEHLALAKQVTHDIHPVHQRAFNDMQGPVDLLTGFLCILDNPGIDAVHEGMGQAFIDRLIPPAEIRCRFCGLALVAIALSRLEQALCRVCPAIEDDILDQLAQPRLDLVINVQLPRIDDAHIHAGLDGVVEKHRVHGPAHRLIAAEGEGDVGQSAGDVTARQGFTNAPRGLDEGHGIIVMFLNSGGHRKDVGIKDDVFRRETDPVDQNIIGPRADLDLSIRCFRLARFVKGHHHNRSPIGQASLRLLQEERFALFQRD